MITTKWPRMVVVGETVTEDQADQILIRTKSWWHLFSNDKRWQQMLHQLLAEFGYPSANADPRTADFQHADSLAIHQWMKDMQILDLEYLVNDRITSPYLGGPHGWCDWDGRIGCATYNIGKWPSDGEVTAEWQTIAEAFPFLNLTAQCVDEEGAGHLAAQWRVRSGAVEYDPDPTVLLASPVDDIEGDVARFLSDPFRERGAPIERIRRALAAVREAS